MLQKNTETSRSWSLGDHDIAALLFSFILVCIKKWEPGGNLDTLWYSAVAKNIFLTGDYFHFFISKYYFKDFFDHMPMTYWVVGSLFKLFGVSDFVARLYPMMCSFTSCFLVYKIGERIKSKDFGLVALVSYALCFGSTKWNGALLHDVPLTAYLLLTFFFFIKSWDKPKYFYLTTTFFVLGIFTKGPVIFGFLLGLGIWSLWQRNFWYLKNRHFYWATVLGMSLLLIPFWPSLQFDNISAYAKFLLWKRSYLAPTGSNHYFAYFVLVTQTATFTFIPYLISPYFMTPARSGLSERSIQILKLALTISLSIIIPFSFFSVKFPHYMLPFYPFFSVVAALPVYLLWQRWNFNIALFLKWASILTACFFVSFPVKTTGQRSKDVINLVNVIKFDPLIKDKRVYFLGSYYDDMTMFQTFKFYGTIDLSVIWPDQVKDVDMTKTYLVIPLRKLPFDKDKVKITLDDCIIRNDSYCVFTDRAHLTFKFPEDVFPDEVY